MNSLLNSVIIDKSFKQEKIIFIAGTGRNGSTVFGNILGQIENCISVGEIRYIWSDLLNGRLCGCGVPVYDCSFWKEVLQQAFGNLSKDDCKFLSSMSEEIAQNYQIPKLFLSSHVNRMLTTANLHRTEDAFRRLYSAVRRISGCNVIVDSSKKPEIQQFLLKHLCPDLYTVHLVRDPRATVYSWSTLKKTPDPSQPTLPIFNKYKTALSWLLANFMISRTKGRNYFFIRYEDWVDAPKETINQIINFAGLSSSEKMFLNTNKINMTTHHTISGNPSRFQIGLVEITPDIRWKRAMSLYQKVIVMGLTWPLFIKYYRQ